MHLLCSWLMERMVLVFVGMVGCRMEERRMPLHFQQLDKIKHSCQTIVPPSFYSQSSRWVVHSVGHAICIYSYHTHTQHTQWKRMCDRAWLYSRRKTVMCLISRLTTMMHIIIIIKLQKKFGLFYHLENFAIFFSSKMTRIHSLYVIINFESGYFAYIYIEYSIGIWRWSNAE